jgi:hypothetical protein
MMATESELKERIKAVARDWVEEGPESRVKESRVYAVVSLLGLLTPLAKQGAHNPNFRNVNKQATERELRNLAARLKAARDALNSLHKPAIEALADADMECRTARWALNRMLNSIDLVDLSGVPVDPERGPSNPYKQALMHHLAEAYFLLTGKHPTRSKNKKSFTDFVREMLKAMSITIGSVENAVRRECEAFAAW